MMYCELAWAFTGDEERMKNRWAKPEDLDKF